MATTYSLQRNATVSNSGLSESARNAERLFETSTTAEIREVETKTSIDIEEKKKQLRQLVGNSYRDLISSADTILAMAACCDSVVSTLSNVKGGFVSLADSLSNKNAGAESLPAGGMQRKALYALASRIKYLVDTSELIWGSLDAGDVLAASLRFLRACAVHHLLLEAAGPAVAARFPLLAHQWPAILKFKGQIVDRVHQKLRCDGSLSTDAAATALAAAAFLNNLNSVQALGMYLAGRRAALTGKLQQLARSSGGNVAAVTQALCACVALLQEAVWQVGELVLPPPLGEGVAQLPACIAGEAGGEAELMFGPPLQGSITEAEAWLAQSAAVVQSITHLAQSQVAASCTRWLQEVAGDCLQAGPQILAACSTAAQLVEVEGAVRGASSAWRAPSEGPAAAGAHLPGQASGVQQVPSPRAGPHQQVLPGTWQGVCDGVVGRAVNVWGEVLEATFLQHAKTLIAASFQNVSSSFDIPFAACLHNAATALPAPAGGFRMASWPEALQAAFNPMVYAAADDLALAHGPEDLVLTRHQQPGSKPAVQQAAEQWRLKVAGLQAAVDAGLWHCLTDALLLCGQAEHKGRLAGRDSYSRREPGRRATALEPYIQEQCVQAAADIGHKLKAHLDGLPSGDATNAATVEQALVIARVATALSGPDTSLRLLLGAPSEWPDPSSPSSTASVGGAQRRPGSLHRPVLRATPVPAFQQLQTTFRDLAADAHERWASWASHSLGKQLAVQLAADSALTATASLRGWQETVIAQEDAADAGVGGDEEVRFSLPGMPSPAAVLCLLAAVGELHRAGGPAVGMQALQLLAWHLSHACLGALRQVLQLGSLTEKGVLQLLMDARFLRDALGGGRPRGRENQASVSASQAATAQRLQDFAALEGDLQEQLDPIDWAMYEPYLWANAGALQQRLGVLFGALLRLHQPPSEVMAKAATGGEANIMEVAPTAQRFAYLPISTPSSAAAAAASGMRRSSGFPASPHAVWDQGASHDYSFAGSIVDRDDTTAEVARAADAASASAFDALQSRWNTQRLGAFGSLLGDKAAEVTAMAQQSLGESASLHSAFTSAFSHLQGSAPSAGGLFSSFRGLKGAHPP